MSVNLVFNKARSKESTALKAALGFRNDEPNAQFSITKGGGDKEFSWLLPVTTNFHNMPSTRELWRQDSAGTRQQENDDGTMKIKEMVLSPRFTWKSGSDTLTVAPSLFRAFGTRRNESTRTDLTVPAAGRSRYDDEDNRTAFNRLRADGEMTRQGIKYSTRFAGSDGERRADVTRTAVDSLGATSISQENTRREERDVNAAFRIDWAVGEQNYVTERRTVLDAYVVKRLNAQFNLRLSLQNLLQADTRRQADYTASPAWWSLASTDTGTRAVLLALEGKW